MTEPHPDSDELVALALADLDAAGQERLAAHLSACATCREEYAEVSDGVQQALAATPAIAPPAGFSGRVLAAMTTAPAARDRPRRLALAVAAGVLAGLLLGIGGTVGVLAWLDRPAAPASQPSVATRLLTSAGEEVGSAGLATRAGRTSLLLNLTAGRPGASYECILIAADGSRRSGGSWTLSESYGSGTASGAWLVPIEGDPPAAVELVSPSGGVWARGVF